MSRLGCLGNLCRLLSMIALVFLVSNASGLTWLRGVQCVMEHVKRHGGKLKDDFCFGQSMRQAA